MDVMAHQLFMRMNSEGKYCDFQDCQNLIAALDEQGVKEDFLSPEVNMDKIIELLCNDNYQKLQDTIVDLNRHDYTTYFSSLRNYLVYQQRDKVFTRLYKQTIFHQQLKQRIKQKNLQKKVYG